MLFSMRYLIGKALSPDGERFGKCDDILIDDSIWRFRYLVASDGAFLFTKRTLLASDCIDRGKLLSESEEIPLSVRREQVESAPLLETNLPVSRRKEVELAAHYNWAPYWLATTPAGVMQPTDLVPAPLGDEVSNNDNPSLRSVSEIIGYTVRNDEKELGEVHDLILDVSDFSVPYLAIDTKPGELGGVRLVSTTEEVVNVRFGVIEKTVEVDLSSYYLQESPSADLSEGRLSIGDQQKVNLATH